MFWIFYELNTFAKLKKGLDFSNATDQTERWLRFLGKCSTYTEIPEALPSDNPIHKAFELMRLGSSDAVAEDEDEELDQLDVMLDHSRQEGRQEGRQEALQQAKEKALGVFLFWIKSKRPNVDMLCNESTLFDRYEADFLIKYVDEHPACSNDELIKAFRKFAQGCD
jgi:hypothetical protein